MSSMDVDNKPAAAAASSSSAAAAAPAPERTIAQELADAVPHVERGVEQRENRHFGRALRLLGVVRRRLTADAFADAVSAVFAPSTSVAQRFHELFGAGSGAPVDAAAPAAASSSAGDNNNAPAAAAATGSTTGSTRRTAPRDKWEPEVELFFDLAATMLLLDLKRVDDALRLSERSIEFVRAHDRHTMDVIAARTYFYYSRCHELRGSLESIRGTLHASLRTATLQHDEFRQTTITNLLLRNYVHYNLYEQADKFQQLCNFPSSHHQPNEAARYHYYLGRIKVIQLDYSDAFDNLMIAMRKAPTTSARGFRAQVQKLACLVQLLMGEIPERSVFRQKALAPALVPYFELTKAVRVGDLVAFGSVLERFESTFKSDKTLTLIHRLRATVIKTGLRKISLAYSRISLDDISARLGLESADAAECIVAKAVRDGVIEAVIDHERRFVQSKENIDVYATDEPHAAFHKRTQFCLNVHNDAVKAMRFPPDEHSKTLAAVEADRAAREKEERELVESGDFDEEDEDML